ncbi:hypothetical protein, partial [Salmonella enterica]|uniref:hypothetical protein n=1 Tax=Salmonella enterica TaxID=28901 RepID=UPI001F4089CD
NDSIRPHFNSPDSGNYVSWLSVVERRQFSRMPYHKPASGQSNLLNQEHYESGTTYVDTGNKY